jgi:hypothetical protein
MLCLPDLDTLVQALTCGAVPISLSGAPARAGLLPDGRICIKPAPSLSTEAETALRRLGAGRVDDDPALLDRDVYCWHQLVPLRPDATPLTAGTSPSETLLFEATEPRAWPALARVFRRLGKALPAFRWEGEEGALLLRATAPPQSLLCAFGFPELCVFRERAPGVWVEAGWRLPQVEQLVPPSDRFFLIRAPGIWSLHDDRSFQEEIGLFALPELPQRGRSSFPETIITEGPRVQKRAASPLRLLPGTCDQAAEFWVLRERPLEQLAALAVEVDDQQIARLEFAVAEQAGRLIALLRIRPSRQTVPLLELPGEGYRACLRLPNLFVPLYSQLRPALRRDALRQLLASDPDRVVWLTPRANGEFSRESVPAAAFRPLAEYVDYAAGQEPRTLHAWEPTGAFRFETFASKDAAQPLIELRKSLAAQAGSRSGVRQFFEQAWRWCRKKLRRKRRVFPQPSLPPRPAPADRVADAVHVFLQAPTHASAAANLPPAEEQPRHLQLEKRFLDLGGPPDLPERLALWPELAAAYQGLSNWPETAVCWLNALWESEGNDLWVWGWYRAAEQSARWTELERDLERVLTSPRPEPADTRALAGFIVFSARQAEPPPALCDRLDRIRACLEANEAAVPVRAAWLAWLALAQLAGGDVLCLARARDRLFERLFRRGLNHEQDMPAFLRGEGPGAAQRSALIRDWLVQLADLVDRWIDRQYGNEGWGDVFRQGPAAEPAAPSSTGLLTERWLGKPPPYGRDAEPHFTKALCELTVAWGLGRTGGAAQAGRFVERARQVLAAGDGVQRFLLDAYVQRITEAVERPVDGPQPLPRPADVETMGVDVPHKIVYLLQQSRILEPHDAPNAPAATLAADPWFGAIRSLINITEQTEQIDRLLSQSERSSADQSTMAPQLAHALVRVLQADESKARELLNLVEPTVREVSDEVLQVRLVSHGLVAAAHFGVTEHLQPLLGHVERLLEGQRRTDPAAIFGSLAELSFRGLRRLGMGERIDRLLARVAERVLPAPWGSSPQALVDLRPAGWCGLLHVAAGWLLAGQEQQAFFVLDQVRDLLVHGRRRAGGGADLLPPKDQTALACAYAAALGQAPLKTALERLDQLFAELGRIHFKHTTNSHYSLAVLAVVEAVVRAVADDDFAVGSRARRWLDEDEYLVRRRIHRDLSAFMGQTGIQ